MFCLSAGSTMSQISKITTSSGASQINNRDALGPLQYSSEGLPRQFVTAMKTLFDVMDDTGSGFVRFSDLETLWCEERTQGVPPGVVASLRKVTLPNGLLSFERFCAGLQICLLHSRDQYAVTTNVSRPPSAPLLDRASPPVAPTAPKMKISSRRGRINPQQRSSSMPQLNDGLLRPKSTAICGPFGGAIQGPPKPPRERRGSANPLPTAQVARPQPQTNRAEIRSALHNWQKSVQLQGEPTNDGRSSWKSRSTGNIGSGDLALIPPPLATSESNTISPTRSAGDGKTEPSQQTQRRALTVGSRRREPRRHTVHNGIDYNMLRRLKQLEQEKDILLQGLQAVERAREWFLARIASSHERMKGLGRAAVAGAGGERTAESSVEASQEKLNFEAARIAEVSRLLRALSDVPSTSPSSVVNRMNLAVPAGWQRVPQMPYPSEGNSNAETSRAIERVKEQNHLLTEEVGRQSERITALEREKSALIRELFQARASAANHKSGRDETVFM